MKTLFRSSISSSSSNRGKGERNRAQRASCDPKSPLSDLVNLVLERSLVFGCGCVNNSCAAVDNFQPAPTFPACAPVRPLIKRIVAATGLQCRDDCFFNAVYRMNKVNFTRREILEEVSPRLTIHPSIERTVSSHE
jgi:hypothetical protein